MSFGMEGSPQEHWSEEGLELAIERLKEAPPVFFYVENGEKKGDTGKKEDGTYIAMGIPVQEAEYQKFIDRFHELLDKTNEIKRDELGKAA